MVPLLEEAGHEVEAPDLPGLGEDRTPIPKVSLQSSADRISQVLDARPEPVVLVGHSSGGIIISQAAQQRLDKVKLLVYLAAILLQPTGYFLLLACARAAEHGCLAGSMMLPPGSLRLFPLPPRNLRGPRCGE